MEKNSPTGIRTPVFHVTGEDTEPTILLEITEIKGKKGRVGSKVGQKVGQDKKKKGRYKKGIDKEDRERKGEADERKECIDSVAEWSKAIDLKSIILWMRRFKSCHCRFLEKRKDSTVEWGI